MKSIGFISNANPFVDRKAWSGTLYKIREAIETAGYKIIWIPYKNTPVLDFMVKLINKFVSKKLQIGHNSLYFYLYALSLDQEKLKEVDYFFFPGGAQMLRYMKIRKPSIYYTDATFAQMVNYYWKNLSDYSISQGNRCEEFGIKNSLINLRSSQWSVDSVINYYGGDPKRTYVLEFGANIDEKDIKIINPYLNGRLKILFSGVEWDRKGADIAIETLVELNRIGIDAELNLVGISIDKIPQKYRNIPNVNYLGFFNKNISEEYDRYVNIINNSHILLLPTKAECSAIIFSEASAYGLPILTYDTGGIGNYCINNLNGCRMPMDSTYKDFANMIKKLIELNKLKSMHNEALNLYKMKLNWNIWSKRFKEIMEQNNL